ncbi:MAG: hypothetical protein LBP37_05610, partial [Spirochaetaceae bacterium]|nr:hypothetical protein [Spirochaetaceae bacterium]
MSPDQTLDISFTIAERSLNVSFIRKVWFNTPRLAAAQVRQSLQRFGIKPDDIINFLTERAS